MAKIFQLELFIKEMSLWKLPHKAEEHDETCVEVTVFDIQNVPINGYVFGKNSTINRGQNFLFTLDAMPSDEKKVFFKVFKKAFNREKNFLGSGNIPLEQIFGDLLSQVLPNSNAQHQKSVTVNPPADPQPAKKNASQTSAQGTLKNNPSAEIAARNKASSHSSKRSLKTANQKQTQTQVVDNVGSTKDSKVKQQGANQSKTNSDPAQKQDAENLGSTNNPNPLDVDQTATQNQFDGSSDPTANIIPIKNLKTVNIASSAQGSPMSSLSKDVYPIIGGDSKQWGTICILMRLTCFGTFSAHPILIHQNHKEIILQNTPNSATYKCIPLDDLKDNNRMSIRRKQQPYNHRSNLAKSFRSSSSSSSGSSTSSSSSRSIITGRTNPNLCPSGPPASPSGQYEEFTAEINENILCVRMPKNVGVVQRIYDKEPSKQIGSRGQSGCSDHVRRIPIIRGNRKYPAHYGALSSLPSNSDKSISIYNQRQQAKDYSINCNENRICDRDDDISCPSNVQIVRANTDPKRDVFLLKIGKDARSGSGIQLEMKTPKNPLARCSTNKQTTSVQTYDDEFVGGMSKDRKKGGKKKKEKK